jgi:hypothetical protein
MKLQRSLFFRINATKMQEAMLRRFPIATA